MVQKVSNARVDSVGGFHREENLNSCASEEQFGRNPIYQNRNKRKYKSSVARFISTNEPIIEKCFRKMKETFDHRQRCTKCRYAVRLIFFKKMSK